MDKDITIDLTVYEREYLDKYFRLADNFGLSEKEILPILVYARKLAFVTVYDFERCAFDIIYTIGTHSYQRLDSINMFGYKFENFDKYRIKEHVFDMVYANIDDEDIKRFKVGIPSPPFIETFYKSLFGRYKK